MLLTVCHTKSCWPACTHNGIRGDVLKWFQNFLKDRTHQTRVGQCLSVTANLLSGVVQGSGIGPVLFLARMGLGGRAQSSPRRTKCNSPPINGQYQLHVVRCDS